MANTISLIAKSTFTHHGRELTPGEPFTASPIEAAALRYQRKAVFAPPTGAPTRRVQTRAMTAETPTADGESGPGRRRQYRRRDMVSEE